jgi:hypothetical protein
MFKKDMTPLAPHSKKGSLHNSVNKAASARSLPGAATGGGPASFQSYGKATPMAQPDQPAPPSDGLGSGSFGGIATG